MKTRSRVTALDVLLGDAIDCLVCVDERLRAEPALADFRRAVALRRQDVEKRRRSILFPNQEAPA